MIGLDLLAAGHGGGHGGHRGGRGFRGGWGGPWPTIVVYEEPVIDAYEQSGIEESEEHHRKRMMQERNARAVASMIGASSSDVRAAQAALKAAGFDPGAVDGKMGPNTEAAITAFWASKGQSHAPVVDSDLTTALARPAKGWSQAQPDKMGPAITPDSDAPAEPGKKRIFVIIAGAIVAVFGAVLFFSAASAKGAR